MSTRNVYTELARGKSPAISATVVVLLRSETGIHLAYGNTVPTDATAGYVIGAIFQHTDGTDATAIYVNEGTLASCDFNAFTIA